MLTGKECIQCLDFLCSDTLSTSEFQINYEMIMLGEMESTGRKGNGEKPPGILLEELEAWAYGFPMFSVDRCQMCGLSQLTSSTINFYPNSHNYIIYLLRFYVYLRRKMKQFHFVLMALGVSVG
jgi:hypothetical protein